MDTQTDKLASARAQGQAQFDSIREMVEELTRYDDQSSPSAERKRDAARQRIDESPLSVEVRSAWHTPGAAARADEKPAEYQILLCTGGPACRIVGELSEHCEPSSARMEVQDWFQPWTAIHPVTNTAGDTTPEEIMLAYASCFFFGE